jgi:hypothetical protein
MMFKNVCRMYTSDLVYRYLLANSHGRWCGALKAQCHIELCKFYVAAVRGGDIDSVQLSGKDFQAVHVCTAALTDHLDEQIGFPLEATPDFEKYEPLFFEKFHELAMEGLGASEAKHKEALEQIALRGTHHDLTPTRQYYINNDQAMRVDEWWEKYLRGADETVRRIAKDALK